MTEIATELATLPTAAESSRKLNLTVDIRDAGPCKKHIQVTIPRSDLDVRLAEKFSEMSIEAPIRGFRPGKAPKQLIERKFYKDVSDQLKTELLLASLEQLAEDNDLNPISPPDLNPSAVVFPKEGDLIYEFQVEVRPEVAAPEYKGLKLDKPVHKFTPAEIAGEGKRILRRMGHLEQKLDGGAVEQGDEVTLSGAVTHEGKSIGQIKSSSFRVEEKLAFKDGIAHTFAAQLSGAKVGDTRLVSIELSHSIGGLSNLAGKTVEASLTVEKIFLIKDPELTGEFLQSLGVSSVDGFHELVEVLLNRRLEHRQRQSIRQQFLVSGLKSLDSELPQDLLMKQARTAMARRVMEMRSDGISEEEIRARQRLLSQDILATTASALKEHFVLQKVAELEKIEVSDHDIENEIARLAQNSGDSARRVRARMDREDLIDALAAELLERKVLDYIISQSELTEVPLPSEEKEEVTLDTSEASAVHDSEMDPAADANLAN